MHGIENEPKVDCKHVCLCVCMSECMWVWICICVCIDIRICDCPNQHYRKIQVFLPTQLNERWSRYLGQDQPKNRYKYCVRTAVHQAGSTREQFLQCWKSYQISTKRKGIKHFHEDVFGRFCSAGFGLTTTGDDGEDKLTFVSFILSHQHGGGEPSEQVGKIWMWVLECMYYLIHI